MIPGMNTAGGEGHDNQRVLHGERDLKRARGVRNAGLAEVRGSEIRGWKKGVGGVEG